MLVEFAMLGKDVSEIQERNFFIWEKYKNSWFYSSCCIWGDLHKGLLPSLVLKEKCPVLKKVPDQQVTLGIVHYLQYPFVILLLEVFTCSTVVLQWLLSHHQGPREPFWGLWKMHRWVILYLTAESRRGSPTPILRNPNPRKLQSILDCWFIFLFAAAISFC